MVCHSGNKEIHRNIVYGIFIYKRSLERLLTTQIIDNENITILYKITFIDSDGNSKPQTTAKQTQFHRLQQTQFHNDRSLHYNPQIHKRQSPTSNSLLSIIERLMIISGKIFGIFLKKAKKRYDFENY